MSIPPIDERAAVARVAQLMAIPGKSGHEAAAARAVVQALRKAGVPASAIRFDRAQARSPLLDGRGDCGNLIVTFPGTLKAPRRLLMAHLDTVPLCAGCRPVRKGGAYRSANPDTALGADNRSGVATVLTAALEILKRKLPHPPLTFYFVVQEEVGMLGVRHGDIAKLRRPKLAFNWDGAAPNALVVGATGAYSMKISIRGIASHAGGRPEEGVSAAAIAGLAIAELQRGGWHGLILKSGKRGTSNIGIVHGGEATNVVMDRLELTAEGRSHDRAFRKRIVAAYRKAFESAARRVKSKSGKRGRVAFKATFKYESFKLKANDRSVAEARRAMTALGLTPEVKISNGGLDANWMTAHGIPTVTMGCGQRSAHTVEERLVIEDYLMACRVALMLATGTAQNVMRNEA